MFGTLISLENTGFRNLIFAIFTRNSSLFLCEMACQNPKSSIFANKFPVPNMVLELGSQCTRIISSKTDKLDHQ